MSRSVISLDNISCNFAHKEVLNKLSLTVYEGEVMAIVGSNGTGKSTLLKIISGLGAFTGGSRIETLTGKKLSIGFAPDRLPKLRFTAMEYLRSMGRIRGMDGSGLDATISGLLNQLGLDRSTAQQLRHFSKGMLQKVNLAQALLEKPDLLLMDEPLSGLDIGTQEELMNVLLQLKRQGIAIVLTTHEKEIIQRVADRVVVLAGGGIATDNRISSGAPQGKSIIFDLGEKEARHYIDNGDGITSWTRENRNWRVEVAAEKSDVFLRDILLAGASIVSVTSIPEKSSSFIKPDQGGAI
ncbi:ABC transporter ATP-binding protein [Cohnella cholangitidis]|uniref:ABC transporter ATP-binding protein n=1 Tax=Cohnella cholangitidis TaxID=2598458 RepID=A0A7G5BX97_9BACL|nr:ABC transporter ATP-binding protein [Cohnella cholangitidis]QMV41581.1 ABC transporter ATP-binding protein [Cohnella cholangitidis]